MCSLLSTVWHRFVVYGLRALNLEITKNSRGMVVDREVVQVQYPVVPSVVTAWELEEPVEPVEMQEK